jgi:filamentous hemagglutinin
MMKNRYSLARVWRGAVVLAFGALSLSPEKAVAQARSLAGGVGGMKQGGSSSSAATSQTSTAATIATAQAAQAAATATRAQTSLSQSVAAFQRLAQQQMVTQMAAAASASNNLGSTASPINGLAAGGLMPVGGIPALTTSSIQVVDLTGSGKNQLNLSNGGTVALPSGTSGTDNVSITGSGSVTSTSGSVSAGAGSLSTSTGGTLAATNGGTISLTAGSATLSATTATNFSSSVAGSYTSGGSTVNFTANTTVSVPAGATVSFSGSSAATVTVAGAGTVKLSGAGTLALSNAVAGAGGTITTNSGTTQFTNAVITSQPAGTTISLTGSGSIDFNGASSDVLPVVLEASTTTQAPPAFTTTGNVLQMTGYNVPQTWSLGTGGSLSQSLDSSTGQIVDTVVQTQQQALLYWTTFNIGSKTTLDFDQSAGGANVGDWVAINRILDPTLNPTQILGAIQAPGQVYVINQNGIIFGAGSQINTHALVASTLPINTNLVNAGLLNNPDGQFLFSSQAIAAGNTLGAYDPNNDSSQIVTSAGTTITQPNTLPNVASGAITVQEGANLFSPGSAEGVGGKIALIAPTVDNEGELSAPDGQVILAAGQQVGFSAHPSQDPSLRGLDVAVGAADTGTPLAAGNPAVDTVTNGATGLIYAPEADVTMTGPKIVQDGIIEGLTSVSLNARIDLLAMSGLTPDLVNAGLIDAQPGSAVGGSIEFGANSITEILPDYASADTEVGNSLSLPSQIYVEGFSAHMAGGAVMIAPNATTTFSLGVLNTPIATTTGETSSPLPEDVGAQTGLNASTSVASPADPQVFLSSTPFQLGSELLTPGLTLDDGALIDVSGSSDVSASVTENIIQAQLTAAVLENSPLQRDGPLHGQTVTVDITQTGTNADGSTWFGSPIGDLSGYANLIEHNVGELTIAGGSVNINTIGAVDLSAGSTINVSGGSIDYQGADVQTTNLVASTGQIVNISQANPNVVYNGIYTGATTTSSKWGVSQTISPSLTSNVAYDPGYVEGGAGGSLNINASSVLVQGSLLGNTTLGARQQTSPPTSSSLKINVRSSTSNSNPPAVNIVIQYAGDAVSTDPGTIDLSADLFGVDGFSNATLDTGSGKITVASDASLATLPGGSLNFTAANVEIDGQVDVPSRSVAITALTEDPQDLSQGNSTSYNPAIGNVIVNSGASIDTTGLTFDEIGGTPAGTLPFSVNGGSVSIVGASTTISAGSSIDASGGLARSLNGTLYKGNGGSISLTGLFNGPEGVAKGSLTLAGTLSAYGIGKGGTLNLTAPAVVVSPVADEAAAAAQSFPGGATPLVLPDVGFSQGGFANFSIKGSAGVLFLSGASVDPILTEEVANTTGTQFGVSLISSSQLPSFPAAPVNLTFSAPGGSGDPVATVTLQQGASITTAPTSSVKLSGQLVSIMGNITAPGGSISITGDTTSQLGITVTPGVAIPPDVTVYLGDGATLNVNGMVLTAPTQVGSQDYTTGQVLAGGSISITGNIVGDSTVSLQADGAVGSIDVPFSSSASSLQSSSLQQIVSPYVAQTTASNGGSISIDGLEEAYFAGSLSAKPGNTSATGGSLTFTSGLSATYTAPPNGGYPEIFLKPDGTFDTGPVVLGQALTTASQTGGGYLTLAQFNAGGFGSLILKGNVKFEGGTSSDPLTINASQEVEILPDSQNGTIFADGSNETITINSPYIDIGATTLSIDHNSVTADAPSYVGFSTSTGSVTATPAPGLADPIFGSATLALNATDLIDVGFLSLQNFGTANLSVPTGDIRGGGLFYAAGTINLTAGQIYTPTAATFTVAAFGNDNTVNGGAINIYPGVERPLPLSAGGTLNFFAITIYQDGNLEAPFGVINLGALPNVSTGLTPVLAGETFSQDSTSQLYFGSTNLNQFAPVTQSLTLGPDSTTSVSGVSKTGEVLDLPYGTILNGEQWIAPNGQDITAGGLPAKAINLNGNNVNDMSGSVINLAGGGDLFAYQFTPGVGGTNDILSAFKYSNGQIVETSANVPVSSTSFAILPTYGLDYAPIDLTIDSTGAFPYANSSITSQIGNGIYLSGGDGIAAGTYAILPARYALLPGAYLITPSSTKVAQTSENPDGSISMAGYTFNTLNSGAQVVPNVGGYTIDSSSVVNNAAPYTVDSANTFLAASAVANNEAVPRLPQDAGQLVFEATAGLQINGSLLGQAGPSGLGSTVDIGSSDDIYIVSNQGDAPALTIPTGVDPSDYAFLTLSAEQLDAFGAGSLLIGGTRTQTSAGTVINTLSNNIYVENDSSTPLSGRSIILVANKTLDVAAGAEIEQSGQVFSGGDNFIMGNASVAGSGDGALLRVTGDPNATFTRLGVNTSDTTPNLVIGAGASVSGVSVTLDSSSGATIDPAALIDQNPNVQGQSLTLNSGAISLQVDPNVSVASASGLVLSSSALQTLETSVESLALSSYSTINLYGAGTIGALDANNKPVIQSLTLEGSGILGFENGGGVVTINAQNVTLGNSNNATLSGSVPSLSGGTFAINANTIHLGANALAIDGFSNVQLNANNGMLVSGTGALNAQGALTLATNEITGGTSANYTFNAQGGALVLTAPSNAGTVSVTGGLGASIAFKGSSVTLGSKVSTPSGVITAVASSGNVELVSGADLDAGGEAVSFGSTVGYTSGGAVNLTSNTGNVLVDSGAQVDVSAPAAGGSAGTVAVSAAEGSAAIAGGSLNGATGTGGSGGTFNATLGQAATLSGLTSPLTDGGFQTMNFDILNGSTTVDGAVGSVLGQNGVTSFTLTTETGAITIDNTINASGVTGGAINLYADEGVTLTSNAVLSVTGQQLDDAGKGGSIDIETRGDNGGVLNLGSGAQLLLGIGSSGSLAAGGTVHLRAPQTLGGTPIAINSTAVADGMAADPIAATISNAGVVTVEAYRTYQPAGGSIDSIESQVTSDVAAFPTSAIAAQLGITGNALYQIQPGVEIIDPSGDLTLNNTWDLSSLRTSTGLPGILTMRASGNLIFKGSLTDGFAFNASDTENVATSPYTWDLLPVGSQSWTYRLVAGAQFNASGASSANFGEVIAEPASPSGAPGQGDLELGLVIPEGFNFGTLTATTAKTYAQLIRTGTGDITIDVAGSVDLMNQLATIYTAGQLAPSIAGFSSPTGVSDSKYETRVYGASIAPAPQYTAQYTENGGSVTINAGQNIQHLTMADGSYALDTSWQFPTSWLYRRGASLASGGFDTDKLNTSEVASTTWWVNFANFFEGIGALGGGNVSLKAGGDIVNVDAVIPTNARMPSTAPDVAGSLVELGGGDLSVIAGGNIEGGTYYIERGTGLIEASNITTTFAQDPVRVSADDLSLGQNTPLPITLFVGGDSSFTLEATNDIRLGSTVNAFLLPQGIGNGFNDESIFSTYGSDASVNVSSLLGSITVQGSIYANQPLPGGLADAYVSNASPGGLRSTTYKEVQSLTGTPWTLTLDPTDLSVSGVDTVSDYTNFYNYSAPIFGATAFSGNINYQSDQTLAPSVDGTMHMLAAGQIEGAFNNSAIGNGLTASIVILDDNPALLPGITNPSGLGNTTVEQANNPSISPLINDVFNQIDETPVYEGQTLTTLQGEHTSGLLHDNPNAQPVEIATIGGDISDFTLISPEKVNISSGLDLQDVSFYIQNNNASDISIVSADRNITLFDPNSSGLLALGEANDSNAAFGDIQIGGPGTLEVLAGGNLDLGQGTSPFALSNPGTNLGITSIGGARNPYLPQSGGASIIAAAGLGNTSGLTSNPQLVDYHDFIEDYLDFTNSAATDESVTYLPDLGSLLGVSGATNQQIWDIFSGIPDGTLTASEDQVQASLTPESRDALATTIFYDVLRDAGRNHNNPASTGFGNYDSGFAAISALFPSSGSYNGNISLTSREFKTENGGDIDMLLPGGSVDVGLNNLGAQAVDQGILTVDGGNISIFANGNVNVGTSRIFTLHGGNVIIWSSTGDVDAGAASRTVQSAPPTRVLVDSQSANVETDLAGLATGGGIGVLETVIGAPPGDVDLIAPVGTVNAGDAGIRASGNVNVAAAQVLNAGNIQAGGSKAGVGAASTPNVAAAVAGSNAAGSSQNAATASANQQQNNNSPMQDLPSIITVQVLGFGGGDDDSASNDAPSGPKTGATYLAEHP